MTTSKQVLGISNAIVDVLTRVDDDFLQQISAPRGSMILIEADRADEIYAQLGPAQKMSGGSVANSIASYATLGGKAAYIGRVADDQFGQVFNHDMQSLGVDVRLSPAANGKPTARCLVLISPDGQRTLQTHLGACTEIDLNDVNESTVGTPGLALLEGYLWDTPHGPAVMQKAMELVRGSGGEVALSLSDALCVERHRQEFLDAVQGQGSVVFADEDEIIALFEADNFDAAVARSRNIDALFIMTRGAQGSVVVQGDETVIQKAYPVAKVVDTTGAGDTYTATFLYARMSGKSLAESADMASYCAAQIVQQVGGRLESGILENYKA